MNSSFLLKFLTACMASSVGTMAGASGPLLDPLSSLTSARAMESSRNVEKAHTRAMSAARSLLGDEVDTLNPDELDARISDLVTGFAGWTHHNDGSSTAHMVTLAGTSERHSAVGLAAQLGLAAPPVVRSAQYDSRQLLQFKNIAFAQASANGVIATYIDREANRIVVEYNENLSGGELQELSARLIASGLPQKAFILRPASLPRVMVNIGVSLRRQHMPLAGGAQFNFLLGGRWDAACTVGVPVRLRSVWNQNLLGFATASHCTAKSFSPDGNSVANFRTPSGNPIGTEFIDPRGTPCQGATLGCRGSDAAFISTRPGAVDFGKIIMAEQPTARNPEPMARSVWPIVGTLNYPAVGTLVFKTGRTTGTTAGWVARSCVDRIGAGNLPNQTIGLRCQTEVDKHRFMLLGDSGAAVWSVPGPGGPRGALIAGIASYATDSFAGFSPWGAVVKDFQRVFPVVVEVN